MKVVKAEEPEYTPVSVTITFETAEELSMFTDVYSVTAVSSLSGELNGPRDAINQVLNAVNSIIKQ